MVKKATKKASKRYGLKILATALLFAVVCYLTPFGNIGFGGGWYVCIRYLDEGVLYAGQPFCAQGPVIFYYGLLLYKLFGWDLLDYGVYVSTLALWLALAYLMKKVADAEKLNHPFLLATCFILLIVQASVNNPETLFSAVFLTAGFYILRYSKTHPATISAGLLFAASLYSKYSAIFPIAVISAHYLKDFVLYGRRLTLTKEALSKTLQLSAPTLTLFAFFTALYPNFFIYTVAAQVYNPGMSYVESIMALVTSTNIHAISVVAVLLTFAFCMHKKYLTGREIFPLASSGIFLVSLSLTHSYGQYQPPGYYALHSYVFLILSILVVYDKSPKLFSFLFFIGCVYPAIIANPLEKARQTYTNAETSALQRDVMSGLKYLPPQEGRILLETTQELKGLFQEYDAAVDRAKIDYATPGKDYIGFEDPFWTPRLKSILGNKSVSSALDEGLTPEEDKILSDLIAGRYSLIMYGPPTFITVPRVLEKFPQEEARKYCKISLPNFYYLGQGRIYSTLIFRNRTHCAQMSKLMAEHYARIYDSICARSQKAAKVVSIVNRENNYEIKKNCASNAEVDESAPTDAKPFDAVIALLGTAAAYTATQLSRKKPPR